MSNGEAAQTREAVEFAGDDSAAVEAVLAEELLDLMTRRRQRDVGYANKNVFDICEEQLTV